MTSEMAAIVGTKERDAPPTLAHLTSNEYHYLSTTFILDSLLYVMWVGKMYWPRSSERTEANAYKQGAQWAEHSTVSLIT